MKWRYIGLGIVISVGACAAGLRTGTGQGYSQPVVVFPGKTAAVASSLRTLELRLTNKETGRPQLYKWRISAPPGSSVQVECHEWVTLTLYGRQVPGFPRNKFRRTIPADADEEGFVEPYHFVARWHPKGENE